MAEKRHHQRITCAEKCLLYYADSRYSGAVMNISISGALVTLYDFTPGTIVPGDTCSLLLSNDPETSFSRYKSRITRVNHAGVGLEILEHEF
jgi:PilZ domain